MTYTTNNFVYIIRTKQKRNTKKPISFLCFFDYYMLFLTHLLFV